MKLRYWQSECISKALKKYAAGDSHFLCLATPGAGKTVMASTLANSLLADNHIDLVYALLLPLWSPVTFNVRSKHTPNRGWMGYWVQKAAHLPTKLCCL